MTEPGGAPDPAPRSTRTRLGFGLVLAVVLAVAVALVALVGDGEGDSTAVAPDPDCIEAWNEDPFALTVGRHDYNAHRYSRAEFLRIEEGGTELEADAERGMCAVVFARSTLDPEPEAAGMVLRRGAWRPLNESLGLDTGRLAEAQSEAIGAANAELQPDGSFVASVE